MSCTKIKIHVFKCDKCGKFMHSVTNSWKGDNVEVRENSPRRIVNLAPMGAGIHAIYQLIGEEK